MCCLLVLNYDERWRVLCRRAHGGIWKSSNPLPGTSREERKLLLKNKLYLKPETPPVGAYER